MAAGMAAGELDAMGGDGDAGEKEGRGRGGAQAQEAERRVRERALGAMRACGRGEGVRGSRAARGGAQRERGEEERCVGSG